MMWFWLSFVAGDRHLGVCIVKGETLEEAVQSSWEKGCNPGGCAVVGYGPVTIEELNVTPAGVNRLIAGEDIERLGLSLRHTTEQGAA